MAGKETELCETLLVVASEGVSNVSQRLRKAKCKIVTSGVVLTEDERS